MKRRHHRPAPRTPLRFGQLKSMALLAGLSVLLAFAAVYVHADSARIVLAFASGISAGMIMYLAANSSSLRKG